ncbi:hypothetical protein [Rhodococcus sovatensis]|uniref:Uncharacterized protein n=1 Tax=Rhodococcus sovatensis TaxID=1805840 RepID=A0ABZ2PI68_9NOCA
MISRRPGRIADDSLDWFRLHAGMDTSDGIKCSHKYVDPAYIPDAGTEPRTQELHAEGQTWYQYWSDGNGSRIDRLLRASDPEDTSTAETYHHTHGWIRSDDAPGTLMRARIFGDWDRITEDEAMRAIKIEHRPETWHQNKSYRRDAVSRCCSDIRR